MHFTHWVEASHHRLRLARRITNHNPLMSPRANARRGFCWPWQWHLLSGSGCWNEPQTWDWPRIWQSYQASPGLINNIPGLDAPLAMACDEGVKEGVTYALGGEQTAKLIFGMGARLTTQELALAWFGGCMTAVFHRIASGG
jgi:hypothetical protein